MRIGCPRAASRLASMSSSSTRREDSANRRHTRQILLNELVLLVVALTNIAAPAEPIAPGRTVEGRALTAVRIGDPQAPLRVMVVGAVHGDEPGARRVTR